MNPPIPPFYLEEIHALEAMRLDHHGKYPTKFKSELELHGYYKQKRRNTDPEWKDKYLEQVMIWIESQ